ncbi:MAG: hypothetical protein AAFV95_11320 [Bacteroidota bacterium]
MKWIYYLLKLSLLLILPFIFLIRGAVYLHVQSELNPWACLLGGMGATILLLVIYFSVIHGRLTGQIGNMGSLKRRSLLALCLVLGYCLYGLLHLSNANAKQDAVRQEYRSLHPILRLSISTILFIDRSLIVTDANRQPEDYRKMGLPTARRSLHYRQKNGFVHAVDIRTRGRSELRNKLLQGYFQMMGLNTLRHGGTADHLHISLKSHDSPGAI